MIDILMFHGTPQRDAAQLERQLRFLSSLFDVVPLAAATQPAGSARRRVALTFDDGLRNNVTVLYPILKRLGLPATFFVCPGLINQRRWLWNHEARERLRSLDAPALAALARYCGAPAKLEPFVDWMKKLEYRERGRVEQIVRRATSGFLPAPWQREAFDIATWDELRTLDPAIISIGSHTMNHPILTSLPPESIEFELRESRRQIEQRLGRSAEHFCYPNGDQDPAIIDCARRHYQMAVSAIPGTADGGDPFLLPRWSAPKGVARLARVLFPYTASEGWLALSRPTRRAVTALSASLRMLGWMLGTSIAPARRLG